MCCSSWETLQSKYWIYTKASEDGSTWLSIELSIPVFVVKTKTIPSLIADVVWCYLENSHRINGFASILPWGFVGGFFSWFMMLRAVWEIHYSFGKPQIFQGTPWWKGWSSCHAVIIFSPVLFMRQTMPTVWWQQCQGHQREINQSIWRCCKSSGRSWTEHMAKMCALTKRPLPDGLR